MKSYTVPDFLDKKIEVEKEKMLALYLSVWDELKYTFREEEIGMDRLFVSDIKRGKRKAITDREIHNLYVFFNCEEALAPETRKKLTDLIKNNEKLPELIKEVNEYVESRLENDNPIQIQNKIKPKIFNYIEFNKGTWENVKKILRFVIAEIEKSKPKPTYKERDEKLNDTIGVTYKTLQDWLNKPSMKVERKRIQTLLQLLTGDERYKRWEKSIGTKVDAIIALLKSTPEKKEQEMITSTTLRKPKSQNRPPVRTSVKIKLTHEQIQDLRSLFDKIQQEKNLSIANLCKEMQVATGTFRLLAKSTEIAAQTLKKILNYFSKSNHLKSNEDKEKIAELKKLLDNEDLISEDSQQSTASKRKASELSEEESSTDEELLPAKLSKQEGDSVFIKPESQDSLDKYGDEILEEGSVSENQYVKGNRSTLFQPLPKQPSYPEVLEDNILPELPMDLPIDSILHEPVNNHLPEEPDDFSFGMSTPKLS